MIELKYVILSLASTLILCVAAIALIAFFDRPVPDILALIATGSMTALAGVLAQPALRPRESGRGGGDDLA